MGQFPLLPSPSPQNDVLYLLEMKSIQWGEVEVRIYYYEPISSSTQSSLFSTSESPEETLCVVGCCVMDTKTLQPAAKVMMTKLNIIVVAIITSIRSIRWGLAGWLAGQLNGQFISLAFS